MAAKETAVKKYVVRLSADERAQLDDLIRKGKRSAQLLTKARILLKADVSGEGWSDSRIAEALDTSIANILRTRRQLVEEALVEARRLYQRMLLDTLPSMPRWRAPTRRLRSISSGMVRIPTRPPWLRCEDRAKPLTT